MRLQNRIIKNLQFAVLSLAILPLFVNCGGFASGLGLSVGLSMMNRNDLSLSQLSAMNDINGHFWTGDVNSGHITTTWNGYVNSGTASAAGAPANSVNSVRNWENGNRNRGGQWDRSTMVNVLYSDYLVNGTADSAARLRSDWNFVKSQFSQSELVNCNDTNSAVVFASDDAGWEAQAFVHVAQVTGDSQALDDARQMIRCTYNFYAVGDKQHGISYNNSISSSGMYETGLMIAAWDLFALTGETEFQNYAMYSYNWMQNSLSRADGLYYMGFNTDSNTVQGTNTPDQFTPGYSVSYLAGNMGMAVMSARIYNLTGDTTYRNRALATAQGLVNKFLNANGTFINDRDAWTEGAHVVPFAREVASMTAANSKINQAIKQTATVILNSSRTWDGYYSADWDGTTVWADFGHRSNADGMALAQQMYTSTQSLDFLIAAAAVVNNNMVIGSIDGLNDPVAGGWACAQGIAKSIRVDVYVGGPLGQGTMVGSAQANAASEPAVAAACGTSGSTYRFNYTFTDDQKETYGGQRVYIYGIAPLSGGSNKLLDNSGMFTVPYSSSPALAADPSAGVSSSSSSASSSSSDRSPASTSSSDAATAAAAAQAAAQAAAAQAAANQAAVAQAAAAAAAAAQAASDLANAQAQAFAAREKVTVYRYVNAKGYHLFARGGGAVAAGYNLEGPVFNIYTAQYASTTGLYRCNTGSHQFLSTDANCEGQNIGGLMGYISTVPVQGSSVLIRFQLNGDYIEATDDSVMGAGYAKEGALGYAP